jgi:hypothetical protein
MKNSSVTAQLDDINLQSLNFSIPISVKRISNLCHSSARKHSLMSVKKLSAAQSYSLEDSNR